MAELPLIKNRRNPGIGGYLHTPQMDSDELSQTFKSDAAVGKGAEDTVSLTEAVQVPRYPEASDFENVLTIANQAVTAISKLRETQLELANRAENSGDAAERDRLYTEVGNLQTEISRIASNTTYQDTDIFDGEVLNLIDQNEDIAKINTVANLSHLTSSITNDFSTQSSAEDAYDELEDLTLAAYTTSADIANHLNEGKDTVKSLYIDQTTPNPQPPPDNEERLSFEQAVELAGQVALNIFQASEEKKIGDFSELGDHTKIHNLDPDQVLALLEEEQ